jgi:hypothetical protein
MCLTAKRIGKMVKKQVAVRFRVVAYNYSKDSLVRQYKKREKVVHIRWF